MCLLWSYVYARTYSMEKFVGDLAVDRLRFFADSGAHSARTLGIDLKVDDYGAWLRENHEWFTIYANLDVIWAPEATWQNQRRLEDHHGLHPMPVFHTGEPWSALHRYLDEGYTYVALGKLLGNPPKVLAPWLARCFELAEGRAVFHGFGLTQWAMLKRFPFYSVDSSSWGSGVRYGYLCLFHRGVWHKVWLRKRDDVLAKREVLDAYGLPYAAVSARSYDRDQVAGACAVSTYRAAEWLRRHHGPIALPPGRGYPPPGTPTAGKVEPATEGGPGTYLAEGSTVGHRRHANGLHLYLADASSKWTRSAATYIGQETSA